MQNKLLNVFYNGRRVGRLAETPERVLAFEYDTDWLHNGFSISPFHLPLEKKVFIANHDPFDGNFGVFNDSLPDGWGRLLTDRLLQKKDIAPESVSLLDRLAIVGTNGTGALEYKPMEDFADDDSILDIDIFALEAKRIQANKDSKDLAKMVRGNGWSNGARPKMFWTDTDGAEWLVKFPAHNDPETIGKLELKYMAAAKDAGLIVPEIKLFNGKYFGTRRFDRKPNGESGSVSRKANAAGKASENEYTRRHAVPSEKVFMISASGLLNANHRMPILDYNNLMQATFDLTRDKREVEKMFRLMCFNVFAHNRDDHAKNFSFLYDDGKWHVSPAYDLVYNSGIGITAEHATMIDGVGKNPSGENILSVAKKADIPERRVREIIDEVKAAVKKAKLFKE
jgi:serine/threonine-protein kinase HipA